MSVLMVMAVAMTIPRVRAMMTAVMTMLVVVGVATGAVLRVRLRRTILDIVIAGIRIILWLNVAPSRITNRVVW
jgi:hypothetical protein